MVPLPQDALFHIARWIPLKQDVLFHTARWIPSLPSELLQIVAEYAFMWRSCTEILPVRIDFPDIVWHKGNVFVQEMGGVERCLVRSRDDEKGIWQSHPKLECNGWKVERADHWKFRADYNPHGYEIRFCMFSLRFHWSASNRRFEIAHTRNNVVQAFCSGEITLVTLIDSRHVYRIHADGHLEVICSLIDTDNLVDWCLWHDFVVYKASFAAVKFCDVHTRECFLEEMTGVRSFLSTPTKLFVTNGREVASYAQDNRSGK